MIRKRELLLLIFIVILNLAIAIVIVLVGLGRVLVALCDWLFNYLTFIFIIDWVLLLFLVYMPLN